MEDKLNDFLKRDAVNLFKTLQIDTPNSFGKMNVLQMLEHVAEWVSISSGKIKFELQTPEEQLPKWKAFLLSEKEMRPNTPNSLMSDEPHVSNHTNIIVASDAIQNELNAYFARFEGKELESETHPFFGPLNYEEWAILHGKHLRHHLRQFNISI